MITLPETLLDKIWVEWHIRTFTDILYHTRYNRVSRRGYNAQKFENWLFAQGAIVQRINKRCYLQFTDEEEALVFRLRYSS